MVRRGGRRRSKSGHRASADSFGGTRLTRGMNKGSVSYAPNTIGVKDLFMRSWSGLREAAHLPTFPLRFGSARRSKWQPVL